MTAECEWNGIIGDVTSPKCGGLGTTATIDWEAIAGKATSQQWTIITTDPTKGFWDLKVRINGGGQGTAAMDMDATWTFAETTTTLCS